MENQVMLLREPEIEPIDKVLENALGKEVFEVYQELLKIITNEFDLQYEWRFYKDGKSWLFKATHKKKTIFWLAAWDKFIRICFYFTEKNRLDILELPINEAVRINFDEAKTIGKLIPLIFDMKRKEQLSDFREIVKYKKNLK